MGSNISVYSNDLSLSETEQILDAIRNGCVDAFVVEERDGRTVYTLQGADLPYSTLVQRMQQGAAMVHSSGEIIYCNPSLAALLGSSYESLIGVPFQNLICADDRNAFQELLHATRFRPADGELRLRREDGSTIPAKFSLTALARDQAVTGILVADLTTEKSNAELAARIQRLQDEERRSIARELHDSVGQLLAAITMNLAAAQNKAANLDSSTAAMLQDCSVMVTQVSKEIRTISHLLHPPLLDAAGLCSAIRWYVDGFSERSNIEVELDMPADVGRLSNEIEIAIYRVVQECLTNVYRHSGSKWCSVKLELQQDNLRLEIRDRGQQGAARLKPASPGLGLRGMMERLRPIGGTLKVEFTENGTIVIVTVPNVGREPQH